MGRDKVDKRGVIEGIGKSFVGLPHSFVLSTEEQGVAAEIKGNELTHRQSEIIAKQGERAQLAAHRALFEIQGIRSATEEGAKSLQGAHWEAMIANGHLSRIGNALEEGLPAMAQEMAEMRGVAEQMVGIPARPTNIDEITGSNKSFETEAIVIALGGGLKSEQKSRLFDSLPAWKKDIIESGLISRHDSEMEKTLSPEEKVFLADLRRKVSSGIMAFGSVETLARHRLLDEDFHFNLSKTLRPARTGIVGVVHGVNELADQGDTRIRQGAESLNLQRTQVQQGSVLNKLQAAGLVIGQASLAVQTGIRTGVDSLVSLGKTAQIDRQAIRQNTYATAENTFLIARGVAAQVQLAQRAEERLDRIVDATEGTYRNTQLLAIFAERANELAEASLEVQGEIADNTAAISRDTHQLVSFAERAELARAIMIAQDHKRNLLLGDIADGIDKENYYQALTREAIAKSHMTLIQGFNVVATIGAAQLETLAQTNSLLATLVEINIANHAELRATLEKIERGMAERHLSVNRARAEERFQEGLGNYRKGKIPDAIALFDESRDHWRNDHRVYFYRGICKILIDKPKEGEEDLKEALIWAEDVKDPKVMAVIRMNLARLYYIEGKTYQENGELAVGEEKILSAILTAQKACKDAPDFYEADFALATYLAGFKLYDEARMILMRIIPKDPKLALKMVYIEEFAPILESLRHTLGEEITESNIDTINKVSIAIIKDCIEIGDFTTAINCMRDLIKTGSTHLLRMQIWEIEELKPLHTQIVELIIQAIEQIETQDSQNCYALVMLAFHIRLNPNEISDYKIFDAFVAGTANDLDVETKNKVAMMKKLTALSATHVNSLLSMNKLHKRGLDWLN